MGVVGAGGMGRRDNIDLRLLGVFVTLAEAQGFAEAQFALNLSASTLSTHLSALERKTGGRLCDRGRGGSTLRIRSIRRSRSDDSCAGRSVSIS